jgi:predicted lipoprotein with Yx(FWY)xxD motif
MPSPAKISVVALAVGALAGCGGGGGSSSPSNGGGGGTTSPVTQETMATSAQHPSTAFDSTKVPGVGTVLVDGRGRTVYVLTSAGKKNVPCTDANGCTAVWPDLPLPKGQGVETVGMDLDYSLLSTMKLSDGETYPTYNGYLMYEYTGDSAQGQANGQGIKSFGGTWYALSPSGQLVKSGGNAGGY